MAQPKRDLTIADPPLRTMPVAPLSDLGPSFGHLPSDLTEARRFEPLTWLEAAIFFLTLPLYKPESTERWHELAVDRWSKWHETKHLLSEE